MQEKFKNTYDVIVIGGGATGVGTARDCAMRGLKTLLVERYDFTNGATGRNHGLLHSGARYAVNDAESAEECIKENMILRKIARHCVEEHDGLFITLPEDDLEYQKMFVERCQHAGIRADVISPADALRREPAVNPRLIGAVVVPDGSIDPFRLTMANVLDAQLHGADVLTYHEVTSLIINSTRVEGVCLRNNLNGETLEARARVTVNAAGIWGTLVAQMAGCKVSMFPAKGSLLVFGHRVNQMVINRCRKPANADILVPGDAITVIGTTSDRVPIETVDQLRVTPEEVDVLLKEGAQLAPALAQTRVIRAYCGVRPLVASDDDPSGRNISRGIVCLDHESRDGVGGFVTITGGKLMTYRLMSEIATDMVCRKLQVSAPCRTADEALPGTRAESVRQEYDVKKDHSPSGRIMAGDVSSVMRFFGNRSYAEKAQYGRHGCDAGKISGGSADKDALVCECEQVTVGEVEYAMEHQMVEHLTQLRRRTRTGMGTCQGQLCALRAACVLSRKTGVEAAKADLRTFLGERWKGMHPVAWGPTLGEAQLIQRVYRDLCGL